MKVSNVDSGVARAYTYENDLDRARSREYIELVREINIQISKSYAQYLLGVHDRGN
jgi:hypothetical protein